MTLTELKEYVQARRIVSELEIAMHFRVEPSVIEPMARRWIDKGLMAKVGGCTACADGIKRHYEWLGPQSVTFVKKS